MTIYAIQDENGGPVKIGHTSRSAQSRANALQAGYPGRLVVRATIPGELADEEALQRQFLASHVHGEWFKPTVELEAVFGVALITPAPPAPPKPRSYARPIGTLEPRPAGHVAAVACEIAGEIWGGTWRAAHDRRAMLAQVDHVACELMAKHWGGSWRVEREEA